MKYIILKQRDGNLYVCAKGEPWGYGIVVAPEIWEGIPDEQKKAVYDYLHKEQFKEKYE